MVSIRRPRPADTRSAAAAAESQRPVAVDRSGRHTVSPVAGNRESDEPECRARAAALDCAAQYLSEIGSTRLNSSHLGISYAVFCLKKKKSAEKDNKHKDFTHDD